MKSVFQKDMLRERHAKEEQVKDNFCSRWIQLKMNENLNGEQTVQFS